MHGGRAQHVARVGGGISVPGVSLSCLLLKAHPSPDESRRGEATTQHPAGKHPTLLGMQGAGVAAAPALGGTASGHMCVSRSPLPCSSPSPCGHRAVMCGLCGSLAANEFPAKEANQAGGINFLSARAAEPSFARRLCRTRTHTGRVTPQAGHVAGAPAHLLASPQGLVA